MTTTIYILKLNDNKYYVGKTNKIVNERYQEHIDGVGSFWTKKYKPLYLIKK
jgi:predicted GIY-YIG superfamily endonuclease